MKVMGVEGETLAGDEGPSTQGWLLDTGENFIAANAKAVLGEIAMTERSQRPAPR